MHLPYLISLCATCIHNRVIKNTKGSMFIMCNLAKTDAQFSKYPALPVIECTGYQKKGLPVRPIKEDESGSPH